MYYYLNLASCLLCHEAFICSIKSCRVLGSAVVLGRCEFQWPCIIVTQFTEWSILYAFQYYLHSDNRDSARAVCNVSWGLLFRILLFIGSSNFVKCQLPTRLMINNGMGSVFPSLTRSGGQKVINI